MRALADPIEVLVKLPRSLLAAAGVREAGLGQLLREALAVDLYRNGQVSLGKAAEIIGVPTNLEMSAVLARHDVWLNTSADEALDDAERVLDALR